MSSEFESRRPDYIDNKQFFGVSLSQKYRPKSEFVRHFVRMPSAWLVPSNGKEA
jgi:hypothetical protein